MAGLTTICVGWARTCVSVGGLAWPAWLSRLCRSWIKPLWFFSCSMSDTCSIVLTEFRVTAQACCNASFCPASSGALPSTDSILAVSLTENGRALDHTRAGVPHPVCLVHVLLGLGVGCMEGLADVRVHLLWIMCKTLVRNVCAHFAEGVAPKPANRHTAH